MGTVSYYFKLFSQSVGCYHRVLFPGTVLLYLSPCSWFWQLGGQGDGGARGRSFCFRPLVSGSDCWENRGTDTKGPSLYVHMIFSELDKNQKNPLRRFGFMLPDTINVTPVFWNNQNVPAFTCLQSKKANNRLYLTYYLLSLFWEEN